MCSTADPHSAPVWPSPSRPDDPRKPPTLEEFRGLGVDFISYTENVDTTTPAGKALFTMAAAFAEFERDLIRERVRSGLDRARAEGKRLGRPPVPAATLAELRKLRSQGLSLRAIAGRKKVSVGVVAKYTARAAGRRQRRTTR